MMTWLRLREKLLVKQANCSLHVVFCKSSLIVSSSWGPLLWVSRFRGCLLSAQPTCGRGNVEVLPSSLCVAITIIGKFQGWRDGQVLPWEQGRQRSPACRQKEEWNRCAYRGKKQGLDDFVSWVQSFLSPRCIPHLDLWDILEAVQSLSSLSYQVFLASASSWVGSYYMTQSCSHTCFTSMWSWVIKKKNQKTMVIAWGMLMM